MNEQNRAKKIKELEIEEATLITILHFHNINRDQTSFRSDMEREKNILMIFWTALMRFTDA